MGTFSARAELERYFFLDDADRALASPVMSMPTSRMASTVTGLTWSAGCDPAERTSIRIDVVRPASASSAGASQRQWGGQVRQPIADLEGAFPQAVITRVDVLDAQVRTPAPTPHRAVRSWCRSFMHRPCTDCEYPREVDVAGAAVETGL